MVSRYVPCPVCREGFDSNRSTYLHAQAHHPQAVLEYLGDNLLDRKFIDDGDWGRDGKGQIPVAIKSCGWCGEETEDPTGSEFCEKCGHRVDREDIEYGVAS